MKFSVVAIVYNEGERLEKCLAQFKDYTDDIVVFDTESSDDTNKIAKVFTNKVWRVPYVGYTSSYDAQIWLKAKYEWCLCVCADEEYDVVLGWLCGLDEEAVREDVVAFNRREIVGGIEQPINLAYHTRVINRNRVWTYELLDPPFHLSNSVRYEAKWFIHRKNSGEMKIDLDHRILASELLAMKYRYTKLEPYVTHVKAYKNLVLKGA